MRKEKYSYCVWWCSNHDNCSITETSYEKPGNSCNMYTECNHKIICVKKEDNWFRVGPASKFRNLEEFFNSTRGSYGIRDLINLLLNFTNLLNITENSYSEEENEKFIRGCKIIQNYHPPPRRNFSLNN